MSVSPRRWAQLRWSRLVSNDGMKGEGHWYQVHYSLEEDLSLDLGGCGGKWLEKALGAQSQLPAQADVTAKISFLKSAQFQTITPHYSPERLLLNLLLHVWSVPFRGLQQDSFLGPGTGHPSS